MTTVYTITAFPKELTLRDGTRDQSGHAHDIILLTMPLGRWYQRTKF